MGVSTELGRRSETGSGPAATAVTELGVVVTHLLKGVLYRDANDTVWDQLIALRTEASDYVTVIGLSLEIDEAEGYAYLRSSECFKKLKLTTEAKLALDELVKQHPKSDAAKTAKTKLAELSKEAKDAAKKPEPKKAPK